MPEYYLTRQETALLESIAVEIADFVAPGSALVEFGSGASLKTRRLLDAAPQLDIYAPIDVSGSALSAAAEMIAAEYPALSVRPIVADFTQLEDLTALAGAGPFLGFFPGSTIGNFAPEEAVALLGRMRALLGQDAILVLGVDHNQDREILERAYEDAAGVTAKFNLNLLSRINTELAGDLDLRSFTHRATWNALESRVEMHLEALKSHRATVAGAAVSFVAGETIHTENSYKYSQERFQDLARRGGWRAARRWRSAPPEFGVWLLAPA